LLAGWAIVLGAGSFGAWLAGREGRKVGAAGEDPGGERQRGTARWRTHLRALRRFL